MKAVKLLMCAVMMVATSAASAQYSNPAIERDAKVERKVEKILKGMTLEQKVGQMAELGIDMFGNSVTGVADDKAFILKEDVLDAVAKEYMFGSVLNAPGKALTAKEWNELITKINEVSIKYTGIPTLYGIDAIHGATYTWASPLFPQEVNAAASFNRELVRNMAEMTAYEVRASNIPWTYSPTLDLGRKSSWPRQWESFSEDAYLTAEMAREMVLGYQGELSDGVKVIHRDDDNYFDVSREMCEAIEAMMRTPLKDRATLSKKAAALADKAQWKNFIKHYFEAYDFALRNK